MHSPIGNRLYATREISLRWFGSDSNRSSHHYYYHHYWCKVYTRVDRFAGKGITASHTGLSEKRNANMRNSAYKFGPWFPLFFALKPHPKYINYLFWNWQPKIAFNDFTNIFPEVTNLCTETHSRWNNSAIILQTPIFLRQGVDFWPAIRIKEKLDSRK